MLHHLDRNLFFWYGLWIDCGKPRVGQVADIMRRTRAAYHYAIRRFKRDEQEIVKERFVEAILKNDERDFWSETKRCVENLWYLAMLWMDVVPPSV